MWILVLWAHQDGTIWVEVFLVHPEALNTPSVEGQAESTESVREEREDKEKNVYTRLH